MELLRSIVNLPWWILSLWTIWLLVMILVPVIKILGGQEAEKLGIQAGVFAQVAVVVALTLAYFPMNDAIRLILGVPILGWLAEFIGSKTGFPFSPYHYTKKLQPQIGDVPILVPLAWLMMMAPSWSVASILTDALPGFPTLAPWAQTILFASISAAAMTAWDFYLDTQMVAWDFWQWDKKGAWFGIPLQNFLGWFLVTLLITMVLAPVIPSGVQGPLLAIFLLTWVLEFLAQFFFWNLRGSALGGALIMGCLAIPTLIIFNS